MDLLRLAGLMETRFQRSTRRGASAQKTRPPYPPEFRREALRLVHASEENHPRAKEGIVEAAEEDYGALLREHAHRVGPPTEERRSA